MKATLILIATLVSLDGSSVRLEEPLGDVLRVGDIATVFYELKVGDEERAIAVGSAKVIESTAQQTLLELGSDTEFRKGHRARFELPLARLSPADLVRLVASSVEGQEEKTATLETIDPAADDIESIALDQVGQGASASLGGAVLAFVDTWKDAWQRQDVAGYLALYSTAFEPEDGSTLAAWREVRSRRLEGPQFIELTLDAIDFESTTAGEVSVRFDQTFRSSEYRDVVRKELVLREEAGGWTIVRERPLP